LLKIPMGAMNADDGGGGRERAEAMKGGGRLGRVQLGRRGGCTVERVVKNDRVDEEVGSIRERTLSEREERGRQRKDGPGRPPYAWFSRRNVSDRELH
jgi:hypothetical protein